MGGDSKSSQTQSSTTAPWQDAQPALGGILGQVNSGLGNTGVTGAENNALNTTQSECQPVLQHVRAADRRLCPDRC
jgi:hypothetical protein